MSNTKLPAMTVLYTTYNRDGDPMLVMGYTEAQVRALLADRERQAGKAVAQGKRGYMGSTPDGGFDDHDEQFYGDCLTRAVDQWFAQNTGLGGCSDKDVSELAAIFYGATFEGGRESVDDALAIVESFGPGIHGLNDTFARQVLLAAEVKRLRSLYEMAVRGRQEMRQALKTARVHIEMDDLKVSHCKDAAAIEGALASPPAPKEMQAESMRERLQKQCSAWGAYWRASDAHGVELTKPQAIELLQDALGVEVEIKDNGCQTCDGTGMIGGPSYYSPDEGGVPCLDCAAPSPDGKAEQAEAQGWRDVIQKALDAWYRYGSERPYDPDIEALEWSDEFKALRALATASIPEAGVPGNEGSWQATGEPTIFDFGHANHRIETTKAEQEEAPSDLSVLRRIHKLLVNQVRPALRSPVITKDVDDAAEALSALMSRTQTEAPSDSTLKLAEMILADCGHSTAISTRLRDRVAERIERHLAAQPTEASCRSTNADGHVLLPFEPTDEMEVAAEDAYEESGSPFPNWKAVYRAMRDAAPSPDGKAEPAQVNISPAERAANAETLERWARASKAEQAEAPSDEVVAVEFYRLNPSAALFDFRNRVATQPTASNAEARGIVAMEHIGTLNPDYPHRLKCKQCGSEAGQVLRAGSDIFDCLCCGFFTYVEGVNLNARAALASKPPQGEQKPDGRLHVDGYFTWSEGKRPAYIADRGLPCDFYLAPAQPEQVAQDSLNLESTIREAFHAIEADDYPRCRAMLLGTLMGLSDRSRRAARARGEGERS